MEKLPPLELLHRRIGNQLLADAPCYNMSFLAGMSSSSNSKQKVPALKESEPPVREVVQGIPTACVALKKKVRKRSIPIDVSPLA
uniref:Uncharacterized protein n=1 Tax=Cannabis sativa TaxID=3483 RepID=A0A803PJU6_CANSA